MRRRVLITAAVAALLVLAAGGGWVALRALPYAVPADQPVRAASVARQTAYLQRWWRTPNPEYGTLGGTDCVDFTSQALIARGWRMDAAWGTSVTLGRRAYAPAWVSSTAMMHWFERRPDLVRAVSGDEVRVGDVAQFDWDGSGDRDHTAIVSRVLPGRGGPPRIEIAEHSPSGLHDSVDARLAEHPGTARVYYWHPLG